jgi:hypothetical protein
MKGHIAVVQWDTVYFVHEKEEGSMGLGLAEKKGSVG